MSSLAQDGRRQGTSKSADTEFNPIQPIDLRQVTVLTKAEWLRIQDKSKGVDKEKERMMEAARQKQALQLKSKEMAKLWPDTLARQRQKKLEAKQIREQMEEEKRKQMDLEEAQHREEKRKEAIEKAKTQLYYETERVKGLHRALLLTEVLKEREAQRELKQRRKSASKEQEKEYVQIVKAREDEALCKEQERAQRKRQESKAFADDLQKQMKENQLKKEQRKLETKKEGEEIQECQNLLQWEQKMEAEKQAQQKNRFKRAQLEHLTQRDISKAADAQKQEAEEVQRKLYLATKEKMVKLRKDKEEELLREVQNRRDKIKENLIRAQQEREKKQQSMDNADPQLDAQNIQQQWEEEHKAEMIKSIAAHREYVIQERERIELIRKEKEREALQAKKEDERIFCEEQQKKTQSVRQELQKLQDFNASLMVAKQAKQHQIRQAEKEFQAKNMALLAEEELDFRQYSRAVVQEAALAERTVIPLCKALREGPAGAPSFTGANPRYPVQDGGGAQIRIQKHQEIKHIHDVVDIEKAKKRLGFMWS